MNLQVLGNSNRQPFSLAWMALKLLGENLYSNPWAAISELVANGFDAGADRVDVLLDISNGKDDAIIEVSDDGSGMDRKGIEVYAQIGYNKRDRIDSNSDTLPMGRKGIGKLAALYLSQNYFLTTKQLNGNLESWNLSIPGNDLQDTEPALQRISYPILPSTPWWDEVESGTTIKMTECDLTGIGEKRFKLLGHKLAQQFLTPGMGDKEIRVAIVEKSGSTPEYVKVEKNTAFNNLLAVYKNFPKPDDCPEELRKLDGQEIRTVAENSTGRVAVKDFSDLTNGNGTENDFQYKGSVWIPGRNGKPVEKEYELTGWIGIHASINQKIAATNDDRFKRDKYHNPIQIRLYVRNKLAVENVLPLVGLTAALTNYIEGEISFNLLDEDDLPDIATTNRQGFDENDERIPLLIKLLDKLIRALINERNRQTDKNKNEQEQIYSRARVKAIREIGKDLSNAGIDESTASNLLSVISNKMEDKVPSLKPKSRHRVFISHSSRDKAITHVIYFMLLTLGARKDEIFYTSAELEGVAEQSMKPLTDLMKECITDAKTRILFVISANFNASKFCLFEGGAGWATRGIEEFDLISTSFEEIPDFLHNRQQRANLLNHEGELELTTEVYSTICAVINNLVEHLNAGREILGEKAMISPISETEWPAPHKLKPNESILDYMNEDLKDLWKEYAER